MAFLDSNNILFKHQYGFRAKHSTIHPIIHLLNDCAEANNNNPKKFTMSIFCDLSKAFDVISHKILLKKLIFYGLRGVVNDWFSSYLTNRTQYVEINNNKSGVEHIKCGVPQGSILGPLLYLLYVNDISKSTQGHILSFADDTSMYISDSNIENLYRRANIAMDDLYDWFCANRLSLNPNKTKFIVIKPFQRHYDCTNLSVCVNNVPLMQIGSSFGEKSTKFLGIYIDESLSWRHHVNHINNKISRALYAIKQVKHFLPIESLHTLYFAFIQPHISYGILAWGNAYSTICQKTILLQKRALRLINNVQYNSHTDPLFKRSKILKINDLYEYQIILFMNDFAKKKLPNSFDNIFKYNCDVLSSCPTRQYDLMFIERCDSTFSARLPLYNFPNIYNKWSRSLSLPTFKSRLQSRMRTHLLSLYPDIVNCSSKFCKQCQAHRQ